MSFQNLQIQGCQGIELVFRNGIAGLHLTLGLSGVLRSVSDVIKTFLWRKKHFCTIKLNCLTLANISVLVQPFRVGRKPTLMVLHCLD
jgi:hypothetical protein